MRKSGEKSLDQFGLFKLDLQFFNNEEDEEHQTLGLPEEDSAEEIEKTNQKLFEKLTKEELIKTIKELEEQLDEAEKERHLAAEVGKALNIQVGEYADTIQKLNNQINENRIL